MCIYVYTEEHNYLEQRIMEMKEARDRQGKPGGPGADVSKNGE
jgi:hypothetical protein